MSSSSANIHIPVQPEEIVEEIVRFTAMSRVEVQDRVEHELAQMGWTVQQDIQRFQVTPHVYDAHMEQLYRESYGFVFATLIFWARPKRQLWIQRAAERIRFHALRLGVRCDEVSILMFGDGSGNDSLQLVREGFRVQWFELPGSKIYDFSLKRFNAHGLIPDSVQPLTHYDQVLATRYDVVLCFEVLEHLPDPESAIADMAKVLKPGGIALITEAFKALEANHPTHLVSNARFDGTTPFLFLEHGFKLTWTSFKPSMKPMEFTRIGGKTFMETIRLFTQFKIFRRWISGRFRYWKQKKRWCLVAK